MTGGRLDTHSLEKIMPGFTAEAPLERRVTREKLSFMTDDSMTTIDFQSQGLAHTGSDSYIVLRSLFDHWLCDKAEAAGANVITGVRVDELLRKDDRVCGIKAGDDEIETDVVVLADGVNSLLATQAGLKQELTPHQVAVGFKEVIALPAQTIEDRFGLNAKEGAAWLFVGCTHGGVGGGFVYTNAESISVGMVVTLSEIEKLGVAVPELLEEFKSHPIIKPLIKGGTLAEYSAHLVPEAGKAMMPKLYGDNVLLVGDAAGLVINLGYQVRGMDLAIGSADCAAHAVMAAKAKSDFSAASLADYERRLCESFVGRDMDFYSKFPHYLEKTPRMFTEYPELMKGILGDMFVVDGQPPRHLRSQVMGHVKDVGFLGLAKDAMGGISAL